MLGRKSGATKGAFGEGGALGRGAKRRSSATLSHAQQFQLDRCLDHKEFDKLIYQLGATADARKTANETKISEPLEYDVQGFIVYLGRIKALSTLLFWKDAEEFTTLTVTKASGVSAAKGGC